MVSAMRNQKEYDKDLEIGCMATTMTHLTGDGYRQWHQKPNKDNNILVFVSAYIVIKLSLANTDVIPHDSMLIISQHSTSIHSSFFIMLTTISPAMLLIYFGCISASDLLMRFNMLSSQMFTAIRLDHWTLTWWGSLLSFHLATVLLHQHHWMALYKAAHRMTWIREILFDDVSTDKGRSMWHIGNKRNNVSFKCICSDVGLLMAMGIWLLNTA